MRIRPSCTASAWRVAGAPISVLIPAPGHVVQIVFNDPAVRDFPVGAQYHSFECQRPMGPPTRLAGGAAAAERATRRWEDITLRPGECLGA